MAGQAGAQNEDIEITPEMIRAGADAAMDVCRPYDSGWGEVAETIYRAMWSVRPGVSPKTKTTGNEAAPPYGRR